jgi:N4-(beta-N-acetylglucosaminyl)-L-asparaginase
MSKTMNRRDVLRAGVAAGLAASAPRALFGQAPTVVVPKSVKPVVVASANGNVYKNGGEVTAVQKAFTLIARGTDVLDAVIAGVNVVELDPADTSVGYGGLPNALGVVQLDSSCMHGPKRRAGAVASLEGVRTPSLVAKAVMEETDHHLLVGKGAQDFARQLGFTIEDDLNTDESRRLWLEWKRRTDPQHYLDPQKRAEAGHRAALQMVREGLLDPHHLWGTINCNGVNAKGEICGVTTTSGLAWKIPGRVGDSPVIGAGCYTDQDVGSVGATGSGEENIKVAGAHTIIENMRRGMSPLEAGMDALKRIVRNYNSDMNKLRFMDMTYYILRKDGAYAGVSLWDGYMPSPWEDPQPKPHRIAVHDGTRRAEKTVALFKGQSLEFPPFPKVPAERLQELTK